jgi:hypothetical protein
MWDIYQCGDTCQSTDVPNIASYSINTSNLMLAWGGAILSNFQTAVAELQTELQSLVKSIASALSRQVNANNKLMNRFASDVEALFQFELTEQQVRGNQLLLAIGRAGVAESPAVSIEQQIVESGEIPAPPPTAPTSAPAVGLGAPEGGEAPEQIAETELAELPTTIAETEIAPPAATPAIAAQQPASLPPVDLDQPLAFIFSPDDAPWKQAALVWGGDWIARLNNSDSLDDYTQTFLSPLSVLDISVDEEGQK